MDELDFRIYLLRNKMYANNLQIHNLKTLVDSYNQLQRIEKNRVFNKVGTVQNRMNLIVNTNSEIEILQKYHQWFMNEIMLLEISKSY